MRSVLITKKQNQILDFSNGLLPKTNPIKRQLYGVYFYDYLKFYFTTDTLPDLTRVLLGAFLGVKVSS
jgi:hypothetical protein